MIKILLDNLVDEYYCNKSVVEIPGWAGLYVTFFYSDAGKISIRGKRVSRKKLRKEIWKRLKCPGSGLLQSLRLQRRLLQCALKAPFSQRHLLSTSDVRYVLAEAGLGKKL